MADWNWIADPIFGTGRSRSTCRSSRTRWSSRSMFVGTGHVWRTKTWGMGSMTLAEFRAALQRVVRRLHGDLRRLGAASPTPGADRRALGRPRRRIRRGRGARRRDSVDALGRHADRTRLHLEERRRRPGERRRLHASRLLAPTTRAGSSAASTSIRRTPNHAWVSYSGFNATTPTTPGHVFEVTYDPGAGTATWVDVSYDLATSRSTTSRATT